MAETGKGYLLIKNWSCGFWSEIEHAIVQLLVAEILGRMPIVYWGAGSLYSADDGTNAFEHFFSPVSALTIDDVISKAQTFFPAIWHAGNLREEHPHKFTNLLV